MAAFALRVVIRAVRIAITMSMIRFQVFLLLSFMGFFTAKGRSLKFKVDLARLCRS